VAAGARRSAHQLDAAASGATAKSDERGAQRRIAGKMRTECRDKSGQVGFGLRLGFPFAFSQPSNSTSVIVKAPIQSAKIAPAKEIFGLHICRIFCENLGVARSYLL
jgi:hypothetical protein